MNISESFLLLNSPRSVITLRSVEKLRDSPPLRVISIRIPGLGTHSCRKRSLDYMKVIAPLIKNPDLHNFCINEKIKKPENLLKS